MIVALIQFYEAYVINHFDFLKFNFHISLPTLGYCFFCRERET